MDDAVVDLQPQQYSNEHTTAVEDAVAASAVACGWIDGFRRIAGVYAPVDFLGFRRNGDRCLFDAKRRYRRRDAYPSVLMTCAKYVAMQRHMTMGQKVRLAVQFDDRLCIFRIPVQGLSVVEGRQRDRPWVQRNPSVLIPNAEIVWDFARPG